MTPDTLLPGQNSTEKGPFNWAWKFTLSDTPKIDSNNYSTLVSQGGSVDEGMLGEYVTLYDTKEDTKDPNTVATSQTNQADPGRKESRTRQLNNNSTKLQTGLSRSEETNNLQPTSNNNNAQAFSNVIQQNYAPQARIQNMQPNYYPQNTNPQIVYVPVATNYQNQNPVNLQYTAQMGSNVMYQPVYTQPVQQAPAQVVYMNGQAYTLQPVGQQYAQANYLQSPLPMNNAMNMQPAYAYVGNGLNQVPTLIY